MAKTEFYSKTLTANYDITEARGFIYVSIVLISGSANVTCSGVDGQGNPSTALVMQTGVPISFSSNNMNAPISGLSVIISSGTVQLLAKS